MKIILGIISILCYYQVFTQDLVLVIDEQYTDQEFDTYESPVQTPGELHWVVGTGATDQMMVDLGDGEGVKNRHYTVNDDGLYIFIREENKYTTGNSLVIEANAYDDINNLSTTANQQVATGQTMYYPWSFRRGYFEVRAKLPEGVGISSAWFLFGTREKIPGFDCKNELLSGQEDYNWQEIDIWEVGANNPYVLRNNIHWSAVLETPDPFANSHACDQFCAHCQYAYSGIGGNNAQTEIDFSADFHTFGLYWDEEYVIYLIDGDIYRYWVKLPFNILPNSHSPHPDPVQTSEPRKILFEDAMVMSIGVGYGIQESGYDPSSNLDGNLNGPNPNEPLPESTLELKYFRYWAFLPCKNQPTITEAPVSGSDQIDFYHNNKIINDYNSIYYGHYETGQNIACSNTHIGPTYDLANPDPTWESRYSHSEQLNLIASEQIFLLEGFHAKSATYNFPIPSQFHASTQTCTTISDSQPMPSINNLMEDPSLTFLENFMASMSTMIYQSYSTDGAFKFQENFQPNDQEDVINGLISIKQYADIVYTIYPNPSSDFIMIKFESLEKNVLEIKIHDQLGNLVYWDSVFLDEKIAIYDWLPGAYVISLISSTEIKKHSFIKI